MATLPIVLAAGGPSPRMAALASPAQQLQTLQLQRAQQALQQPVGLDIPTVEPGNMALADALLARSQREVPIRSRTELLGRLAAFGVGSYLKDKEQKRVSEQQKERRSALLQAMGVDPKLAAALELGIDNPELLRGAGVISPKAPDASKAVRVATETRTNPATGKPMMVKVKYNALGDEIDVQSVGPAGTTVNVNTPEAMQRIREEAGARAGGGIEGRAEVVRGAAAPEVNKAKADMQKALADGFGPESAAKYEEARRRLGTFEAQRRLPGEAVTDDSIRQVLQSVPSYTQAKTGELFGQDVLGGALSGIGAEPGEKPADSELPAPDKPLSEMTDEEFNAYKRKVRGE